MLPAKTKMLQRATVFNKETRNELFKQVCEDKSLFYESVISDQKPNLFFRNYHDYLYSLSLSYKGECEKFKPISLQKAFTSKYILDLYKNDLAQVPKDKRVKKIIVFDTETTDIAGYIVSYAFVFYDVETKKITKEVHEFLNPKAKISEEAYEVHKITEESVKDKPTFREHAEMILSYFEESDMLVGHNILYDMGVMKRELERIGHQTNIIDIPIFDTMYYAVDVVELEKKKMPRLEECVAYFFGPQSAKYHDALEDVKMTLKVFEKLFFN